MDAYQITILVLIIVLSVVPWAILGFFGKKINSWAKKKFNKSKATMLSIQEISNTIKVLNKNKKGATFIIKQNDDLTKHLVSEQTLNAELSSELMTSIFITDKSPLHDGAVIIDGYILESASAFITTLSKQKLPKGFGTRHRSAQGLTEETDAIAIVISEETGKVSIFKGNTYKIVDSINDVSSVLTDEVLGVTE